MTKNNWRDWTLKSAVILIIASCGGDGFKESEYGLDLNNCTTEIEKEFVHQALLDRYYWYDQIPKTVNYDSYSSASNLLADLRYQPETIDRFSYITSASNFNSFFEEGQYVGFGFGFNPSTGKVLYVFKDSPAGFAGLNRGDFINAVDGNSSNDLIENSNWQNVFGESTIGVNRSLEITHQDESQSSIDLTKDVVTINSVLDASTFNQDGTIYANLSFYTFFKPSYAELSAAFETFANAGAEKLILDLRYNRGGSVAVAAALASYIHTANENQTEVFTKLKFNSKYSDQNYQYSFSDIKSAMNLNQVIILTSDRTCSASEMVINGLKPFINVTTIGSTTCGKPIGMRPQNFCSKKLVAINFTNFNALDEGNYFSGINAQCYAKDDENSPLGDPSEGFLKAALDFDSDAICNTEPDEKIKIYKPLKSWNLDAEIGAV